MLNPRNTPVTENVYVNRTAESNYFECLESHRTAVVSVLVECRSIEVKLSSMIYEDVVARLARHMRESVSYPHRYPIRVALQHYTVVSSHNLTFLHVQCARYASCPALARTAVAVDVI